MSQTSGSDDDFVFEAEMSDPKKLISMLRSIHIMKTTVMAITCRGLKLTCQDSSRCLQANSFVDRSLFTRYYMSSEEIPVTVCFRLSDLIHVLTLLGNTTSKSSLMSDVLDNSLRVQYSSNWDKIRLQFREDTTQTKAYIKTYTVEELMTFNMNSINKVILSVEPIVDFWKSADLTSDYIEVAITSTEPYIRWTTESERAKVNHNIHRDSSHVEQFLHSEDVSNRYRMSLMKFTLKALIHSSKLSIRTDTDGLLSLQFMVKLNHNSDIEHCFVEYFIVPEVEPHFYQ